MRFLDVKRDRFLVVLEFEFRKRKMVRIYLLTGRLGERFSQALRVERGLGALFCRIHHHKSKSVFLFLAYRAQRVAIQEALASLDPLGRIGEVIDKSPVVLLQVQRSLEITTRQLTVTGQREGKESKQQRTPDCQTQIHSRLQS